MPVVMVSSAFVWGAQEKRRGLQSLKTIAQERSRRPETYTTSRQDTFGKATEPFREFRDVLGLTPPPPITA